MEIKHYLIHWNIAGNIRNKKDTFKRFMDKAHHNLSKLNIIEAQAAFKFIDKHYKRVNSGPTYNAFHHDHIFINENTVNLVKTKELNNLTNLHKSDHKPIIVELIF